MVFVTKRKHFVLQEIRYGWWRCGMLEDEKSEAKTSEFLSFSNTFYLLLTQIYFYIMTLPHAN